MMKVAFIVFIGLFLSVSAGPSDPEEKPDAGWLVRHQGFVNNTLANPSIPILFYGDSITDGWAGAGRSVFDQFYAPLGVANYGIGGDRCEHVLWRIINGEVQGLTPKLVVLKIGTNNLGAHTDEAIAGGVATIVQTLRQLVPTAKVLVLGVLPRNGAGNFDRIVEINRIISALHNGNTVFYLDMFGGFIESWGVVPTSLFSDGLHLTTAGYQKWAATMNPLFNSLLA